MSNFIVHNVCEIAVSLDPNDGYVNATALTQAHKTQTGQRKDVHNWLDLKRTKETFEHLSVITGIPVIDLKRVSVGSPALGGGTWIHPRLAVRFAMWLSDDFGLMVEDWVREWQLPQQIEVVQQPKLPPYQEAVQVADSIRHITDTLDDNPRLAQVLIDHSINEILEQQKTLTGSDKPNQPQLRGVVEIATEMGYKTNLSSRVKLGQFIATQGFHSVKEKRLCNGIQKLIHCYEDSDELRKAIRLFFD